MCSIGERIKQRRKEIGLTQLQIKSLTGISSGNMSDIENGRSLPATPALIKLSQVLNCSIDWIVTGSSNLSNQNAAYNPQDKKLLDGFHQLTKEEQDELLEIMHIKLRKLNGTTGNHV